MYVVLGELYAVYMTAQNCINLESSFLKIIITFKRFGYYFEYELFCLCCSLITDCTNTIQGNHDHSIHTNFRTLFFFCSSFSIVIINENIIMEIVTFIVVFMTACGFYMGGSKGGWIAWLFPPPVFVIFCIKVCTFVLFIYFWYYQVIAVSSIYDLVITVAISNVRN